jgi:hypothetical protein
MIQMKVAVHLFALTLLIAAPICIAQSYTTNAPDGTPGISFAHGCVSSPFFSFTYNLPDELTLEDMSHAPNGGNDPTHRAYALFMASRDRGINRDVVEAAAEDRRSATDSSAASWMRALHHANATRNDVPTQDEVETVSVGDQELSRLAFQQSRSDGVITYEVAYAFGVKGYVVFFILGSVDHGTLAGLEKSIQSLSFKPDGCGAAK